MGAGVAGVEAVVKALPVLLVHQEPFIEAAVVFRLVPFRGCFALALLPLSTGGTGSAGHPASSADAVRTRAAQKSFMVPCVMPFMAFASPVWGVSCCGSIVLRPGAVLSEAVLAAHAAAHAGFTGDADRGPRRGARRAAHGPSRRAGGRSRAGARKPSARRAGRRARSFCSGARAGAWGPRCGAAASRTTGPGAWAPACGAAQHAACF